MTAPDGSDDRKQNPTLPSDLVFFSPRLLFWPRAGAPLPAQRLARRLLDSVEGVEGWPSPWSTRTSPERRLERMVLGCWRVYAQAGRPDRSAADRDAWEALRRDVAWAETSQAAGELLTVLAREETEDDAGELSAQVQRALGEELLPLLHLRGWLAAEPEVSAPAAGFHAAELRKWAPGEEASESLILTYALYVAASRRDQAPPTQALRELGRAGRLGSAAGRHLVEWVTQALTRSMMDGLDKNTARYELLRMIGSVDDLIRDGVSSLHLYGLLSVLHFVLGAREMADHERLGSSARRFASAVVYDPGNLDAWKQLHAASQLPGQLRVQIEELRRQGRARPDAMSILGGLEREIQEALAYPNTEEARTITRDRQEAMRLAFSFRLGRLEDDDRQPLDALAAAAGQVFGEKEWKPGVEYARAVEERARELDVRTGDLPWHLIRPGLQQVVVQDITTLAPLIPEPPTPALEPLVVEIKAEGVAHRPVPEGVLFHEPTLQEAGQRWLLGGGDLGFKLAGAVGAVAILLVTMLTALSWIHDARLDRAYRHAEEALAEGDDARLVGKAVSFLKIVDEADDDERIAVVTSWLEEGLVREVVALVEAGEEGRAERLLSRYEDLRTDPDPANRE